LPELLVPAPEPRPRPPPRDGDGDGDDDFDQELLDFTKRWWDGCESWSQLEDECLYRAGYLAQKQADGFFLDDCINDDICVHWKRSA
jgi:hypothetical protein